MTGFRDKWKRVHLLQRTEKSYDYAFCGHTRIARSARSLEVQEGDVHLCPDCVLASRGVKLPNRVRLANPAFAATRHTSSEKEEGEPVFTNEAMASRNEK